MPKSASTFDNCDGQLIHWIVTLPDIHILPDIGIHVSIDIPSSVSNLAPSTDDWLAILSYMYILTDHL